MLEKSTQLQLMLTLIVGVFVNVDSLSNHSLCQCLLLNKHTINFQTLTSRLQQNNTFSGINW